MKITRIFKFTVINSVLVPGTFTLICQRSNERGLLQGR
jgi:hypothetical protein